MVDWRTWPKDEVKFAGIKSRPEWSRSPEVRKEILAEGRLGLPMILVGFGIPSAIAYGLLMRLTPSGTGLVALSIVLGAAATIGLILFQALKWAEEWCGRKREDRVRDTLEKRGESLLGDEIVGVVYQDGMWRDSIYGDSWDWGALRLDFDRFTFIGRFSNFDLTAHQIRSVEIRWGEHLAGPMPRLFVRWDDGGPLETLSLELPYIASRRKRMESLDHLRDRIDRWRREPLPSYDKTPLRSPIRGSEMIVEPSRYPQIGLPAKILSGIFTVGMMGFFGFCLGFFRLPKPSSHLGAFAVVLFPIWTMLSYAIEKRLPSEWQYREPLPEVSHSLGEAFADDHDEKVEISR